MTFDDAVSIAGKHPDKFCEEFLKWLPDNQHVWDAFVYEVSRVRKRGFKHYSARTIIHFLRHHTSVSEAPDDGWKINNNHSPYMARLYDLCFPQHAGLWSYRDTPKARRFIAFEPEGA